jgi:hypothetical protein
MTTTEHTTSPVTIAEQLVGALAAAWRAIKARHAEVPEVVLTVGSGTIGVKPGQARFGHFAAARTIGSTGVVMAVVMAALAALAPVIHRRSVSFSVDILISAEVVFVDARGNVTGMLFCR